MLKQLTPVLVVDAVEPGLAFWADRFGFAKTIELPGPDGRLIFGAVQRDGIEVMYQTRASVIEERPEAAGEMNGKSIVLFIQVDSIDDTEKALAGAPVVKARHDTFYGSTEIYVREPGGHVVGFAQMKA
jgi:uncharacterized glyoxalase superfamily protein PhnB